MPVQFITREEAEEIMKQERQDRASEPTFTVCAISDDIWEETSSEDFYPVVYTTEKLTSDEEIYRANYSDLPDIIYIGEEDLDSDPDESMEIDYA
jgi:hypothetical protein